MLFEVRWFYFPEYFLKSRDKLTTRILPDRINFPLYRIKTEFRTNHPPRIPTKTAFLCTTLTSKIISHRIMQDFFTSIYFNDIIFTVFSFNKNIPNSEGEVIMLDEIKKGLLSGLGAIFLTKDKVERITRKMVDEAKMSREDARDLKEELYKTGEREWAELEDCFSDIFKKVIQGLDLCSGSEFEDLKKRVDELEKRLTIREMEEANGTAQTGSEE